MFSTKVGIQEKDRLSDIKLNDLLHNFCELSGLSLTSLKIDPRLLNISTSATKSTEGTCWSSLCESIDTSPKSETAGTKRAPEDQEYCFVDPRRKNPVLPTLELELKEDEKAAAEIFSIYYFIYKKTASSEAKEHKSKFVVFSVSRDQEHSNSDSYAYLANATNVIKAYQANFPADDAILLLPIVQCGMYMKLDYLPFASLSIGSYRLYDQEWAMRKHFVLAVVHLKDKKIHLYDPQGLINGLLYWENLKVPEYETIYHNLNQQKGHHLCGYYIHTYIHSILKYGNENQLPTINIPTALITSQEQYLQDWPKIIDHVLEGKLLPLKEQFDESKRPGFH